MTERTLTAKSRTEIATEHASKYLQQLCKHFAHKRPATFDEQSGHVSMVAGDCHFKAVGGDLLVTVEAEDAAHLPQLEDVIVRHLVRFAFREDLQIEWQRS